MNYARLLQLPLGGRILACIFMLLLVAILGGLPGTIRPQSAASGWAYFTNFLHQPLYAGVGLSFLLVLKRPSRNLADWLLAAAFAVGIGVLDEVHQHFVRARSSSLLDLGSDGYGAFCAAYLAYLSQLSSGWMAYRRRILLLLGLGLLWNCVPSFSAETPLPFLR